MARSAKATSLSTANAAKRLNVDSGTSDTLVPPSFQLNNKSESSLVIRTADNSRIKAVSCGKLPLDIKRFPPIRAHLVPGLAEPLLSVSDVTDQGVAVTFLRGSVLFTKNPSLVEHFLRNSCEVIAEGSRESRSCYLYEDNHVSFRTAPLSAASYLTWHHRLSHTSLRSLQELRRRGEIEVTLDDSDLVMKCEDRVAGKFSRINTKSRLKYKVSEPLARVHLDLCSLPSKSYHDSKYIMSFLDEHTHFGVIYFLKSKDQAFSAFKHYVAYAERVTGNKLKNIRTDNGGEYTSREWKDYCSVTGIRQSQGPPHSPQLHGVAERFNCTLLDKILPSLLHAKLPARFWEASAHHAIISYNLTPTRSNPGKA